MGRMPRPPYQRPTPACAVDGEFIERAAKALALDTLSENACIVIAYSIHLRNAARRERAEETRISTPRRGRPKDLAEHIFVDGMLDILESEMGINARASKSNRQVKGRVSEFLRIIWDALEHPFGDADYFARLAENCDPCLGKTKTDRRNRRAARRAPRAEYDERIRNAWKQ
jgi:hypothetical protein